MTKWKMIHAGFYSMEGLLGGYIGQVSKNDDGTWTAIFANRKGEIIRCIENSKTMTRAKNHVQRFASETLIHED